MELNLGRAARRAAVLIVTVLAAFTATASASSPTTIGADVNRSSWGSTNATGVQLNTWSADDQEILVPSAGTITLWRARFDCSSGCGQARLVVLQKTSSLTYDVVASSAWENADEGVQAYAANIDVAAGDALAIELDGSRIRIAGDEIPWEKRAFVNSAITGSAVTFTSEEMFEQALYNAEFAEKAETSTSVGATPNPAVAGEDVTYSIGVSADGSTPTGTVSLKEDGIDIPTCQDLDLGDGEASCEATAPLFGNTASIEATYSGDDDHAGSVGTTQLDILQPATVTASVVPNPVARLAPVVYKATITGAGISSVESSIQEADYGTVAFSVDGQPIAECDEQPVDHLGVATCARLAPAVGGGHTLKAEFSGSDDLSSGEGQAPFTVLVPAVSLPPTLSFGSALIGTSTTKTVTLTNSGAAPLIVDGAAVTGSPAFTVVSDGCLDAVLAASQSCAVQVKFAPSKVGAYTASLVFDEDSNTGIHSVALLGIGVTPPPPPPTPEPPVAPEPTPTPTPTPVPPPGGKLVATTSSKGSTPTLTVAPPPASKPASAPVLALPLACPADEECGLSGRLTITTSALARAGARAAAGSTKTVAKFTGVQVKAGKLKTIKLKLSPSFVKSAQKQGIRRIQATLTINTVFGSGQTATTRQRVTIVLPRAAQRPAQTPRFTG